MNAQITNEKINKSWTLKSAGIYAFKYIKSTADMGTYMYMRDQAMSVRNRGVGGSEI